MVEIRPSVRVVIVHYRTIDLLQTAVTTLRAHYPNIPLTIVDNGATEETRRAVEEVRRLSPEYTQVISVEENGGHGPGMDLAIRQAEEHYIFCLDSDTVVDRGGFLEEMSAQLQSEGDQMMLGVGRIVYMDRRGFGAGERQGRHTIPALDPAYMMIDAQLYRTLPRFAHHGSPVVGTFAAAQKRGLQIGRFEIETYITHLHRGTVQRHGYGLGLKSKIDFILHKLGF